MAMMLIWHRMIPAENHMLGSIYMGQHGMATSKAVWWTGKMAKSLLQEHKNNHQLNTRYGLLDRQVLEILEGY